MSELWYWRTNERIHGPLVTEELEALVRQRRLADRDHVRLDGSDEWIPAVEIRLLFENSSTSESPAATAAKLLESAAARRLRGTRAPHASQGPGGLMARCFGLAGEFAGNIVELVTRAVDSLWRWLGRIGRTLLTSLAALAILVFLVTRLGFWQPSETFRLQQIKSLWQQVRTDNGSPTPKPPLQEEAATWLQQTQAELESALRDQPVSGAGSASARRTALARREMLFAVRALREPSNTSGEFDATLIDRSLKTAEDYLIGATVARRDPVPSAIDERKRSTGSTGLAALIVVDTVLVALGAVWWFRRRSH
jgi:hypothetical protein